MRRNWEIDWFRGLASGKMVRKKVRRSHSHSILRDRKESVEKVTLQTEWLPAESYPLSNPCYHV